MSKKQASDLLYDAYLEVLRQKQFSLGDEDVLLDQVIALVVKAIKLVREVEERHGNTLAAS